MKSRARRALHFYWRFTRGLTIGVRAASPRRSARGRGGVGARVRRTKKASTASLPAMKMRDRMIKLYYMPDTCALASHIALEEAGANYSTVRIDFATDEQRSPN